MPRTGSRIPPFVGGVARGGGGVTFSGACIGASYVTVNLEGCLPNETTHSGLPHVYTIIGSGYHSDWLSGVDGGRIIFNGDGSGVQFVIPHTLTRNLTVNDTYHVTPASSGSAGDFFVTLSGAGGALLVNYKTAPASGTSNVIMQWGVTKLT